MIIKNSKLEKIRVDIIKNPGKWIIILLATLFIVSIIGIVILVCWFPLDKDSFWREVGNTLLQIISVGVLGTILSLLLAIYNKRQEDSAKDQERLRIQNENKNQFVKNILRDLNETYSGFKSARRMIRAKAFKVSYEHAIINHSTIINTQIYDHYLEKINDYQLGLETILSEIDKDTHIFNNYSCIKAYINQMQEYLHGLVHEYENYRFKASADSDSLMVGTLDKIRELINHAKDDGPLKVNFIYPYKKAIAAVRNELLDGNKTNL